MSVGVYVGRCILLLKSVLHGSGSVEFILYGEGSPFLICEPTNFCKKHNSESDKTYLIY